MFPYNATQNVRKQKQPMKKKTRHNQFQSTQSDEGGWRRMGGYGYRELTPSGSAFLRMRSPLEWGVQSIEQLLLVVSDDCQ